MIGHFSHHSQLYTLQSENKEVKTWLNSFLNWLVFALYSDISVTEQILAGYYILYQHTMVHWL